MSKILVKIELSPLLDHLQFSVFSVVTITGSYCPCYRDWCGHRFPCIKPGITSFTDKGSACGSLRTKYSVFGNCREKWSDGDTFASGRAENRKWVFCLPCYTQPKLEIAVDFSVNRLLTDGEDNKSQTRSLYFRLLKGF